MTRFAFVTWDGGGNVTVALPNGEDGCNQPHPHHRPGRSSRLIGAPGSPPDENREF
jgi:hypothetical protein